MSTTSKSNWLFAALVLVGSMFIGGGIGMIYNEIGLGGSVGLGGGLIAMSFLLDNSKMVTSITCIGCMFIGGGTGMIYDSVETGGAIGLGFGLITMGLVPYLHKSNRKKTL